MALASAQAPENRGLRSRVGVPEMWTSLAIGVIWLVVLVDALFGPDIVSSSGGGFARVPSAVVLGFFAWLSTWAVARYGFRRAAE